MANRWQRLKFGLMLRVLGAYRQITLGARCAVVVEGKILLVRHGYTPGWHLPGGGVDPGETAEQAARREVLEETGYRIEGAVRLVGLYHSTAYTNRDHVALFAASQADKVRAFKPNREIGEIGWFGFDALPPETSPATLRRISEVSSGSHIDTVW